MQVSPNSFNFAPIPFTREGWDDLSIPAEGIVSPVGAIPVTPESLTDTEDAAGTSLIGILRPVLEHPSVVSRRGEEVLFLRPVSNEGNPVGWAGVVVTGNDDGIRLSLRVFNVDDVLSFIGASGDAVLNVEQRPNEPNAPTERTDRPTDTVRSEELSLKKGFDYQDTAVFKSLIFGSGDVVFCPDLAMSVAFGKAWNFSVTGANPTPAQAAAGNYPKRRIKWRGLTIAVETEAGSIRTGVTRDGVEWANRMHYPYGYFMGTVGVDGDPVDVFVGAHLDAPMVYIVRAMKRGDWERYDEDKVMIGFLSADEAERAYLLHYDDARFFGGVDAMPVDEFVAKVRVSDGEMLKADSSDIPAGARWITLHPAGEGTKGVPVLVMPQKDGTHRIIGGAGGKLNMLHLRGVKSPEHYRAEAAEKAKAKREENRAKIEADKAAGVHAEKQAARESIRAQKTEAEKGFISDVVEAMGWGDVAFDPSKVPEGEDVEKAEKAHHAALLKKAKDAVNVQRRALVADADLRAAAGLGEVPFSAADESILTLQDLDPVRLPSSGLDPDYKGRAEANGYAAQKEEGGSGESPKLTHSVDLSHLAPKVAEARQAVALLKAHKNLQAIEKAAREANKAVQSDAYVEPSAYVLKAEPVDEDAIRSEVLDKLTTAKAGAFVESVEGAGDVSAHVLAGAHGVLESVGHIVGGRSLLDRSVVDVLGIAGAAQVLARRLHGDLGADEANKVADALEAHHVGSQVERMDEALSQSAELRELADQLELEGAHASGDLALASEINHRRQSALLESKRVLGEALGQLEAHAAVSVALREGARDSLDLSLGDRSAETATKQLWALGLDDGDYSLEKNDAGLFVRVNASGMDKLALATDPENADRVSRNLAIAKGAEDEADWLPDGFARRPDLAMPAAPAPAESLAQPFDHNAADLQQALRDYIGGRTADGDPPADILADVQSGAFFDRVGQARVDEYRAALDAVVPMRDPETGKMRRVEDLADEFDKHADAFVESRWGGMRSTLNKQSFEADHIAQDALHRALASEPAGVSAYKSVTDLTDGDQRNLREWFYANIAREDAGAKAAREKLEAIAAQEPDRYSIDLFGEQSENPDWHAWKSAHDEASQALGTASLDWGKYIKMMRGRGRAFEAIQDAIRSRVSKAFADHYNSMRPSAELKVGRTLVRNNLDHLSAIDPAAREKRLADERAMIDSLRERVGGRYASGSVKDKLEAAQEQQAAFDQAQMGFFASDDLFGGDAAGVEKVSRPLDSDERHTIGHAAETQIQRMMGVVGRNFQAGQPVKLFNPSMSGTLDGFKRQRAVKFLLANKRMILGAGVGSGKTALGLGGFSHLHSNGQVKKGLFVVPSIVQGQFGAEALRFLEAGKFNWHCEPSGSFESRLAAYKDPETHFAVVTHQSFRDDMLKLAAMRDGVEPEAVADRLAGMSKSERATFMRGVMDHHGIGFDYVMADEAHGLLNREGKDNSRMSNAIEGVTDNAGYYVHASADPVKNDASEAFSLLQKMDATRYSDRGAFMRKYGGDSPAARDGLRRELARHLYAMEVKPQNVQVNRVERSVDLTDGQREAIDQVEKHAAAIRIAKMSGSVNVDAARALAPSMFDGLDESEHGDAASRVADAVGMMKNAAIRRVIESHKDSANLSALLEEAKARKGQGGVVFARSLEAVRQIHLALEQEGFKVATITGADSSESKAEKIRAFNPESGERQADIVVASDAGAVGANLQSGQWLAQYDTPDTAMVHAQRQGRINRVGQKSGQIDLIDLVPNHPTIKKSRDRLAKKYALRETVTTPLEGLDDTGLAYHLHQMGVGAPKTAQDSLF